MSDVKIEKGIPLANKWKGRNAYPWDQMEVGDSFFVAGKAKPTYTRADKRFTLRTVDGGVRVWRIR